MKGRKLWKYLLALAVIAVMSIFMTACGGSSGGEEEEAAADDVAAKVKVGISWQEDINADEHGEDLMAYINTVEKAGGEPVLLDLVKDQEGAKAELAKVDCLVLTGGEDIDPSYYGEEPDPALEDVNKERDVSDMAMLQEAIDEDMPTLCTCRGAQVLNVLSGGSLYQDIPSTEEFKDSGILHRDPEEVDFTYHEVTIEKDSLLSQIVGKDRLNVNSWHHQGLKDIGENLKVTATSDDGMVECIERTDCTYVIGVQWHPEWSVEEGDDSFLVFFTDLMARTPADASAGEEAE